MQTLLRTTIGVALAASLSLGPVAAAAGGFSIHFGTSHGHSHGGHGYRHDHGHKGYGSSFGRKRHHPGYRKHGHDRGHRYGYRTHRQHGYVRHCRPVHKYVVDEYGYTRKIGGTLCYDRHGYPFIVPGSRYLDREY